MSFCLGNILGPITFRPDAPRFMPAKISIVATVAVTIVFTLLLKFYYIYENKRRDSLTSNKDSNSSSDENGHGFNDSGFLDLTDMNNLDFRVSFIVFLSYSPSLSFFCYLYLLADV